MVPSTPRSLVRLKAAASGPSTGSPSSRPSSDQVPLERTAAVGDAQRRGDERRRGVVAGHQVDVHPVAGAAERRAGLDRIAGERRRREAEPRDQLARPRRPRARPAARWWRRRSPRWRRSPREPEVEQVGHERDPLRRVQGGRVLVGEQLEDRVDRHRLDAGDRVELLARHPAEGALGHALRARVAVVEGQPEHAVAAVEQGVVDAPGVDADPVELAGPLEAVQRLGEEVQEVPAQAVRQPHGAVGEAVHDVELDTAVAQLAPDDAPALGAQVDRREGRRGGGAPFRFRQGGRPPPGAGSRPRRRATRRSRPSRTASGR